MLFCMCVCTALAQITDLNQLSNDKTYFIESARCFLTYSTAHTDCLASSNGKTVLADEKVKNPVENENQQFKILNEGGSYYLYSVGAEKYVNKSGNYVDTPTASDALTITNNLNGSSYPWKILIGGNGLNSQDPDQKETGVVVDSWTQTDEGNCFKITAIEDIAVPITKVDDLSNSKLYSIVPKDATRGVLYATSTSTRLDACGGTRGGASNPTVAVNHKSSEQQFALYNHEGNIYLYSVGANKFVGGIVDGRYFQLTDTPTHSYTVVESDPAGYFIIKLDNSNYINVSTGWEAGCVGAWATQDDGNQLVISAVANMPESVSTTLYNAFHTQRNFTYTFKYNGEVKATQTCSGNVNEAYPEVDASLFPYGVTATKPEGTIPSDVASNIELELTVGELPFEATEDVNAINKWYFMQMHSNNKRYIEYIADGDYMEWTDTEVNAANRDAYMWAFVGNIWDGFKLVNKAATTAKAIKSEGSGNPGMDTFAKGTSFVLKKSKVADGNGFVYFCLQYPNGEHLNAQSGKVAHWWDTDAGSAINLFEVPTLDAELATLVGEIEAKNYGSCVGETVGYLTAASVEELNIAIATAKAVQGADADDLIALQNAEHNLKTIQPEEGKFYIVKSAMPDTDGRSGQKMYVNNDGGMKFNNQNAAAFENVFQFVSDGAGKFYLKAVERGTFMNTNKSHNGGQEMAVGAEADAKAIAIANMGRANAVSLIPTGGAMMHAQAAGSQVVAWNNTDNAGASAWIIEEVNIEDFTHQVAVSAAGYSTLVLGYNAEIPGGVEAYVVSSTDNGWATLTPVTGVLPAGEAVVLKNEGTYNFNYTTEAATEIETNLLEGTVFNTYIEGATNTDYYVLSVQEGEVGLYKAALNKTATGADPEEGQQGTHFKNNAFKAYLPLTTTQGVQALRFNFSGETTAIETVETENANAPIYDLSGRRVLSTVKGGIYIQNGKKFIVK